MTTQRLSSSEVCKLRYDTIPVKKCICKRFFLYQKLKNAKFWVVTLLSQMSDMLPSVKGTALDGNAVDSSWICLRFQHSAYYSFYLQPFCIILSSPKRMSLAKFITWLPFPSFSWMEWLGDIREILGESAWEGNVPAQKRGGRGQ